MKLVVRNAVSPNTLYTTPLTPSYILALSGGTNVKYIHFANATDIRPQQEFTRVTQTTKAICADVDAMTV